MLTVLLALFPAHADPYSPSRGTNAPTEVTAAPVVADDGTVVMRQVVQKVKSDTFGNAAGNQHDLVVDGAFEGQTVAVLHFYTDATFDFSMPKAALAEKGFSTYRWIEEAPSPSDLREALAKSSQLWIISDEQRHLTDEHVAIIKRFFDDGHGVYIWGDNLPYYTDANVVAEALFGGQMLGNLQGEQTVTVRPTLDGPGLALGHDITTGLEYLYEGHTIATLQPNPALKPLLVGSAGNLVAATYEQDGKRAVLDGGFTRLYIKWDTAGSARYVKNAAAWLVNYERFGDAVVGSNLTR